MGIISIRRDWGVEPSIVRITTTDNLAAVVTTGYLTSQSANIEIVNKGAFEFAEGDSVLVSASDGSGFFELTPDFASLVPDTSGGGSVTLINTGTGLTGGPITTSGTISLAPAAPHTFLANITSGSAAPTPQTSTTTVQNLGLGNASGILVLSDADFAGAGGTYILTNPPPTIVSMSATTAGRKLQLPPSNQAESLQESQQIELLNNGGTQAIGINNGAGTLIFTTESESAWRAVSNNRTTVAGSWEFLGEVQTINGSHTGNVLLESSLTTVYISNDGSDVPAVNDGSVLFPYASLSYALSQIAPSSTTPYRIVMNGIFTETNLALKPWCAINGTDSSSLTVTGSVTLDASWSAGGELTINNFFNITWPASVTLDFNVVTSGLALFTFANNLQSGSTALTITGHNTTGAILLYTNNINFSGAWAVTVNNCYGALDGGDLGNIAINHTSETAGGNFNLIDITQEGTCIVTDNTTAGLTLFHTTCKCIGLVTYAEAGAGTFQVFARGTQYLSAPTLDNGVGGGSVNFDADILDALPTLLNGAIYNPSSIADAMSANNYFTPSNYTPTGGGVGLWSANSVVGNLKGIDLALAGGGGGSTVQFVYIAPTGDDTLGNGTISKPFLTYEKARTYAQSLTPSPSNQFMIVAAPGQYTGMTDLIYDPWVHLSGENAYFQGSGSIVQDGFIWGNNNNQSFAMIGPNLVLDFAGSINFDMTGVTPRNNIFILQGIRYINLSGFTAKGVGTSTWYVKDVRPMSVTQTGANPPFINFAFQDCYGEISDSSVNNLSYALSGFEFESESLPFQIKDNTIHGNWSQTGVSGIKTASIEATGNAVYGTISASGSDIFVDADVSSVWSTPVITSGATFRIHGSTGVLIAQQLWVNAASGSDSTGNGNINNPFATYAQAISIATPLATVTNQYLIKLIGNFSETITFFPFVNVDGENSGLVTASGNITADSTFNTIANATCNVANLNLTSGSPMLVLFNTAANGQSIVFDNCSFGSTPNLAFEGNSGAEALYMKDCFPLVSQFPSGIDVSNGLCLLDNVLVTGSSSVNNTGTIDSTLSVKDSEFTATIFIDSTSSGGGTSSLQLYNTINAGYQLSGTLSLLSIDPFSYTSIPAYFGGSTISQVTILSLADSILQTSFTPVNYTPVGSANYAANSLTANLAGIDAQLAAVVGAGTQNIVWVGTNGVDSVGRGTFDLPYATIAFAMSQITTASSGNPFLIMLGKGNYTQAGFAIKPFVDIDGNGSVFTATSAIFEDGTWSGGGTTIFRNFVKSSFPSGINMDFSTSTSQASFLMQNISTTTADSFEVIGSTTVATQVDYQNVFGFVVNRPTINVQNVFGSIDSCQLVNLFIDNNDGNNRTVNVTNCNVLTALSTSSENGTLTINLLQSTIFGGSTQSNSAPGQLVINNNSDFASLVLNGNSNLVLNTMGLRIVPTLIGTPVLNYIELGSTIQGVVATIASGSSGLTAGSVVVSLPSLALNNKIALSYQTVSGTPGAVYVSARTDGTGFTITSTSVLDTSTIFWQIYA